MLELWLILSLTLLVTSDNNIIPIIENNKMLFPPSNIPAPNATNGGSDNITLINIARKNLLNVVFVNPSP